MDPSDSASHTSNLTPQQQRARAEAFYLRDQAIRESLSLRRLAPSAYTMTPLSSDTQRMQFAMAHAGPTVGEMSDLEAATRYDVDTNEEMWQSGMDAIDDFDWGGTAENATGGSVGNLPAQDEGTMETAEQVNNSLALAQGFSSLNVLPNQPEEPKPEMEETVEAENETGEDTTTTQEGAAAPQGPSMLNPQPPQTAQTAQSVPVIWTPQGVADMIDQEMRNALELNDYKAARRNVPSLVYPPSLDVPSSQATPSALAGATGNTQDTAMQDEDVMDTTEVDTTPSRNQNNLLNFDNLQTGETKRAASELSELPDYEDHDDGDVQGNISGLSGFDKHFLEKYKLPAIKGADDTPSPPRFMPAAGRTNLEEMKAGIEKQGLTGNDEGEIEEGEDESNVFGARRAKTAPAQTALDEHRAEKKRKRLARSESFRGRQVAAGAEDPVMANEDTDFDQREKSPDPLSRPAKVARRKTGARPLGNKELMGLGFQGESDGSRQSTPAASERGRRRTRQQTVEEEAAKPNSGAAARKRHQKKEGC